MANDPGRRYGGTRSLLSTCQGLFLVVASRLGNRRLLYGIASRFASRRFVFAVAALCTLAAKAVHIFAHLSALGTADVLLWGLSFFAQDTALLLLLRVLLDEQLLSTRRWLQLAATTVATVTTAVIYILATANISFFAVAGSEVHWRNIGFVSDKSSRKVLLSGLASCILVGVVLIAVSWAAQGICYALAGIPKDIVMWPFARMASRMRHRLPQNADYSHVQQHDDDGLIHHESKDEFDSDDDDRLPLASKWTKMLYVLFGIILLFQILLSFARPAESSLTFMSWTLLLLPWVDFAHSSPSLASLLPFYGTGMTFQWDARTALAKPIHFDWLPKGTPLSGFEDWYESGKDHYSAAEDPLKISNIDDGLLPGLREKLADIKIRHVVLLKLESTRKDVFPIKKNGFIWNRLAGTFDDKTLPTEAQERFSTLTPNANFLTGDYDDGFKHGEKRQRGGINFNNAYTTATYTLKSMTGTLCGITPLVADFNVEWQNHIYQPCLPHIFEAFNELERSNDNSTHDFTSFKWRSSLIQSITDTFDKQDLQMPFLGYKSENFVYKEYLKDESAKFGVVDLPDINYYGMAEVAVEDYIRDAFVEAEKNDERVFLTHFTSTTHHPFAIPEEDPYVPLSNDALGDLSHYVNSVGYVDRWLGRILGILDEQKVANETLLIMVGDHGISVAENDGVTPYYNPNIGNFHVPLVVSHPQLPKIDVNDAVESLQILPSILDFLLETGSLSEPQSHAAHDLVRNYEGQSLIRPLRKVSHKNEEGHPYWQFTVMNPGRAMLAVRDARQPNWRLIVPAVENVEWRFTDLGSDPHEDQPILAFGFLACLLKVEAKHSIEAAKWAEEAAFMARWWVEENRKRYRYEPDVAQSK